MKVWSILDLKAIFYFGLEATIEEKKVEGDGRLTIKNSAQVLCPISWTLKVTPKKSF